MRAATGADVALINGGGIRAGKVYPPGTILTRRDLRSELPFGNKTVVLEVSGADLRAAVEHGGERSRQRCRPVCGTSPGMAYRFDASKPAGRRIAGVTVGDAPLDPTRTYRLATFDFLGRGGDGVRHVRRRPADRRRQRRYPGGRPGHRGRSPPPARLPRGVEGRIVRLD